MVRRTRQWGVAVALVALVAGLMGGCSSSDEKDKAADKTTTTAPPSTSTTVPPTLAPVPASGGVTMTPNPVPVSPTDTTATVKVSWVGQKPRTLMFLRVCWKSITDPSFRDGIDCSLASELTPNGSPDGNGSIDMPVFRGENPDGDSGWGCFAESDQAPPGVQKNTTCYVRVTNDVTGSKADAREVPFTFTVT
jgi:hypothetical protein